MSGVVTIIALRDALREILHTSATRMYPVAIAFTVATCTGTMAVIVNVVYMSEILAVIATG